MHKISSGGAQPSSSKFIMLLELDLEIYILNLKNFKNYAIRSIPDEIKQSWMTNPEKLKQVLMYHLVQPGVRQAGLANNQMVETGLKGQSVRMNFYQSVSYSKRGFSLSNLIIL